MLSDAVRFPSVSSLAVSILEKLQVPDGWCSSGLSSREGVDVNLLSHVRCASNIMTT